MCKCADRLIATHMCFANARASAQCAQFSRDTTRRSCVMKAYTTHSHRQPWLIRICEPQVRAAVDVPKRTASAIDLCIWLHSTVRICGACARHHAIRIRFRSVAHLLRPRHVRQRSYIDKRDVRSRSRTYHGVGALAVCR